MKFKDSNSPMMEQLLYFHDWVMLLMVGIIMMTLGVLASKMSMKHLFTNLKFSDNQKLEFAWTTLPGVVLVMIGVPSLRILYLLDEVGSPLMTLKVVGHQWYWSYEYSDMEDLQFDAYMDNSLNPRLLQTDHHVVLPFGIPTRVVVTAADVLHSWALPTAGIKADCIPGRLNQVMTLLDRSGVYYGQCSEICGSNHSFMPIALDVISISKFISWL
uniref:Cytochrome c oxidase subunit 2 n=1 Tax=Spadella cephaloptera TaxID=52888 RepID=A0A141CKF3_9BILA|nr:cytochrome c oxidase subunit 2 [Spadella cephaloptera]